MSSPGIDPATALGCTYYVNGTDIQYRVMQVKYNSGETACIVTLDTCGYPPPKEVLEKCLAFRSYITMQTGCEEQKYECDFDIKDISNVPFGSPLAQAIYST